MLTTPVFFDRPLIHTWSLLAVIVAAGCVDSNPPPSPGAAAAREPGQKADERFTHQHCHPSALGPSHVADEQADQFRTDGTRKMAERLKIIDLATNPETNEFVSDRRVAMLEQAETAYPTVGGQFQLGLEYLRNGQPGKAIKQFERTEAEYKQNSDQFSDDALEIFYELFGLAYLRLGEIENCVHQHSADSCLVPISGDGIHRIQRGSKKAAEIFREALGHYPESLKFRWLLNVAHMTIGEWPDEVEPQWQIPPEAFVSESDFPRFYDRAIELGVDAVGMLGGSITEDFDRDGDIDLVASSWGLKDQLRYFENKGDGKFEDRTIEAGLIGLTSGINLIHADYDNDGLVDIFVLRGGWVEKEGHYPNSLLRNLGEGRFADVTQQAGLLSMHPTQTAVWSDFDRDGLLDLFIGNETWPNDGRHACELYRNRGDGTFEECAISCGIDVTGIVKGVTAGDYDNDGWSDIYISRFNADNILFKNWGPQKSDTQWLRFQDVSKEANVQAPLRSFPTWFWDFDNDGWLDIFVAGFWVNDVGEVAAEYLKMKTPAERPRLYRNLGDGTFEDVTDAKGLDIVSMPMGANYGDMDNDGWPDIYLGTGNPSVKMTIPNRVFRSDQGRRFLDITTNGGFGHLQKGHGVSLADIDNDGDQDIFTVLGGAFTGDVAFNALYENPGNSNHWLTLRLIGTESNRDGIGARIRIELETPGGDRVIHALVGAGGSFGASSLQQELGLGDALRIKRLEIAWPSSEEVQRFEDIPMDGCIEIKEGEATFSRIPLHRFPLGGSPSPN
ncbi:MAG: CRTAC1 family protein [Pirellulales bacterium]|nr:CRTAC1 family protein [Pirellulales bacterium]